MAELFWSEEINVKIDLYIFVNYEKKNQNFISDFQNWKMADEVAKSLDLFYGIVSFVVKKNMRS